MEQNTPMVVQPTEMVEVMDSSSIVLAQNKAEIDMQIATAKQYPRDVHRCLNDIVTWGTMDDETAQSCFYSLTRKGATGNNAVEGLSVRMAEIIIDAWGNARVDTRVVADDGKQITAQAVCIDLERNVAVRTEVRQRCTDKYGKPYTEDMKITVSNAACAKAFRNAVLKVVPKAITAKAVAEIKNVAMGKAVNMTETRTKLIAAFANIGVKEEEILEYLDVKDRESIDKDMVFHLRSLYQAIKDGETSVEDSIKAELNSRKAATKKATEDKTNRSAAVEAAASLFNEPEKVAQPK